MATTATSTPQPQQDPDFKACRQVLETPELLEAILLLVAEAVPDESDLAIGPRTVLLSQRVNKMFRGTVTGSVLLQRALWFEPDPDWQHPGPDDRDPYSINPFFGPFWPSIYKYGKTRPPIMIDFMSYNYFPTDSAVRLVIDDTRSMDGKASWRRMFIIRTKVPVTHVLSSYLSRPGQLCSWHGKHRGNARAGDFGYETWQEMVEMIKGKYAMEIKKRKEHRSNA